MALSESVEYDKIEVVGEFAIVQVRKRHIVKKDGVELASSFERYALEAGTLDESDNFVDNPLDKESDMVTAIPDKVKNICNAVWTSDIKTAFKAHLIANKPTYGLS
tara:strand:- start:927 stop:1244 length:318 start_codon:yes stop_codon:yes gene_type:complete